MSRKGKDIAQAIQNIANVKPRQKNLAKKVFKKKEITSKGALDSGLEERTTEDFEEEEKDQVMEEQTVRSEQCVPREDVPDGAQISKAFDTLCNIIRDRMRRVRKPEPIADFFTKGRYVLVTGDSNFLDPCFLSTTPSASHVYVTVRDGMPYWTDTPSPLPSPPSGPTPQPLTPSTPPDGSEQEKGKDNGKWKEDGKGKPKNGEPHSKAKEPEPSPIPPPGPHDKKNPSPPPGPRPPKSKTSDDSSNFRGPPPMPSYSFIPPDSMSYEKVEVVESVEKLSPDKKVKGYEETTTVVETMIEKTSRKKHSDRSS